MAGLADGSASLSMSGREELMALKQTGRLVAHSPFLCIYVSLSLTLHILYILYFAGAKLNFCQCKEDTKPLFPPAGGLLLYWSCRTTAVVDLFGQ